MACTQSRLGLDLYYWTNISLTLLQTQNESFMETCIWISVRRSHEEMPQRMPWRNHKDGHEDALNKPWRKSEWGMKMPWEWSCKRLDGLGVIKDEPRKRMRMFKECRKNATKAWEGMHHDQERLLWLETGYTDGKENVVMKHGLQVLCIWGTQKEW